MSTALHGILVSRHGHRFECFHCNNCNGLDYVMIYTGDFDPAAGFPPAALSVAVLRSWLVVLDAHGDSSSLR